MIKQFFKKVLISYLIIICCIYTPTAQAAFSFGGFNPANNTLNIVKDGVRITTAAVDTAPITSNLGKKILSGALRGANLVSTIALIADVADYALDWVLDPANNAIKYRQKSTLGDAAIYMSNDYSFVSTDFKKVADYSCKTRGGASNLYKNTYKVVNNYDNPHKTDTFKADKVDLYYLECTSPDYPAGTFGYNPLSDNPYKSIPVPLVAQKHLERAKFNTDIAADVADAAADAVAQGAYDTPINKAIQDAIDNGTLPKTGTGTDTGTGTGTNTDTTIDTSSIIAAIQSLAKIIANASSNTADSLKSVINTSIDKLLNKQDQMQGEVVNVGSKVEGVGGKVVGVGDKVDSVGGKVVGVGDAVKDVGGKVVGLNDSVDKVGGKVVGVGDKVDAVGDKVGTKVDAVGDKVDAVGDKVDAVGDKVDAVGDKVGTKVDAVGDKVTGVGTRVDAVGDKVDAAGEKTAEAIKESTKEITKKMDETKPKDFELPAFCSWASKVCDFIDWVKKDDIPENEQPETPKDLPTIDVRGTVLKPYVSFPAGCPSDPSWSFLGGTITFPLHIICQSLSMLKFAVLAYAYIRALAIIGGGVTSNG